MAKQMHVNKRKAMKNDKHDNNKKEKKKTDKRRQTSVGKSQGPTKLIGRLKQKNITGVPITKIKQLKNGVNGYATNRKIAKPKTRSNQIKLPKAMLKQNLPRRSKQMPTWLLSTL